MRALRISKGSNEEPRLFDAWEIPKAGALRILNDIRPTNAVNKLHPYMQTDGYWTDPG